MSKPDKDLANNPLAEWSEEGPPVTDDQELAICLAQTLYGTVLCGQPTARQRYIYKYMTSPVLGSVVVEQTTLGGHRAHCNRNPMAFGRLIAERVEVLDLTGEQRQEYGYDPGEPTERFVYLETRSGKLARWHNARFLRVPEGYLLDDGPLQWKWGLWYGGLRTDQDRRQWARLAFERHGLSEPAAGFRLVP